VENRHVLEDLIYGTYLSRYNYGIIHEESPDERGIDVCLIYRKDLVKIIDTRSWIPDKVNRAGFRTRYVLYAKCSILGDTFHIIVNHWPSRRGGVLAGETVRTDIGRMVRDAADSLGRTNSGRSKIIILGDFNCTPDDNVIEDLINPDPENGKTRAVKLINLADTDQQKGSGTYKYSGTWELIDQVIVSEWLLRCHEGFTADINGFRIFKPDFLLMDDPKFPGLSPFSTYRGYRYQGGFSDHLPVLLDLVLR
jgi:predicted extracellular nuclease